MVIPNKEQIIVSATEPTGVNRKKIWMQKRVIEAYQATAYQEDVKATIYIKNDNDVYEEFIKNEEERINITTEMEYATNEYIDGNRVYRKRILLGNGPDSSLTKTYPIGIEASNIIKTNVIMKHATLAIPLPIVSADTKAIVNYYIDGTNLIMQAGRDRSSFVVRAEIYYIKQKSEE